VTEAAQTIDRLKRKVMWRARLIALQDYAAIVLIAGGTLAASIALYIKLKPIQTAWWPAPSAAFVLIAIVAVALWFKRAVTEREVAFKIDRALELEDRITTTQIIIERGGPVTPIEVALVEDAARHVADANERAIVPYTMARWHALSLIGVAALVTALAIPQKALPESEQLIVERANIESAGDRLEQTATEVEKTAPAGTETAKLAGEQADLGRSLRRTIGSKAEALKKLSALEERIRERHDELASTRADEIVSLAEKRLQPALAPKPKESQIKAATDQQAKINQSETGNDSKPAQKDDAKTSEPRAENKNLSAGKQASSEQKRAETNSSTANRQVAAERKPPEDAAAGKSGDRSNPQPQPENRSEKQTARESEKIASGQTASQPAAAENKSGEQQKAESDKQPSSDAVESLAEQAAKALPESMVEQAAKAATPMLSDQLLKQAEQLRANQLTPENIKQLRQAAESLARDLAPIAQSKEFQQQLEQLARQVNPEQLERVARELMSQENIRRELESAARLLMENKQAREMVAGLAEQFKDMKPQTNPQNDRGANQNQSQPTGSAGEGNLRSDNKGSRAGQPNGRGGRDGSRIGLERNSGESKLTAQGKEVKQGGTIQRKPGGEYLYLQSKPGAGAARAPYSSAYPQYRREAERSVERSQVPTHMRSIIRRYFDAINPDANKKP
jgi:hypothetical protein